MFITNAPVFDQLNRQSGIISVSTDIAERKTIELQVERSEQRYRSLFQQSLAGFYEMTVDGTIISCNDAFAKMLKYNAAADLIGKNMYAVIVTANNDRIMDRLLIEQNIQNHEGMLLCKDGSALYYLENLSLRADPVNGNVADAIILDISQKKMADFALEQSESRIKGIIASQTNYILRTDLEGCYSYYNPKYFEDFGYIYHAELSYWPGYLRVYNGLPPPGPTRNCGQVFCIVK